MKYQHKSRWSRIIFFCLCLSVVEKGWVTKTHPFEVAASLVTPQLLYLVGLACSLMQRDTMNSAVDHLFRQEMDLAPHQAPVHENKRTASACIPAQRVQNRVSVEPIKPVTEHYRTPAVVKEIHTVVNKTQAVVRHKAHEQVVQAAYGATPEEVKAASQELVSYVTIDWKKQIEKSCQESLRHAQAHADHHMLAELRALNPGVTYETHQNGGVTCYAPNPIFSLYLGPSRRQHTPSLADDIVERRAQERIQLACDPELRAAVTQEFCAFLRNDYCLLYGTLLERIAALLYLADFHIDVVAFGHPLNAIQKEIYAEYACKDGSICIDRLADMTDAHAIVKKHIVFQNKMAPHFEKPCRPSCGVCQNKGKQCEHLRQLRKNSQLIKQKKNVDLQLIRNNHTNQCYKNMLLAFAAGNMQKVERIKNDNSSIAGVQALYEQIRLAYDKMVIHQESLLKDAYGIWHFKLPAPLWDPLYMALSNGDRLELQNNPTALASFNDALLMRHRYKDALHKAWNIPTTASPVVHQALYALIDSGAISERIEKIHALTNNPALSQREQKELVEALFLPNGIIKDFAEYERAQSLKISRAILQPEHSEARKLLNQLVYAERIYEDHRLKSECTQAIEYLQKAVTADGQQEAAMYLACAHEVYKALHHGQDESANSDEENQGGHINEDKLRTCGTSQQQDPFHDKESVPENKKESDRSCGDGNGYDIPEPRPCGLQEQTLPGLGTIENKNESEDGSVGSDKEEGVQQEASPESGVESSNETEQPTSLSDTENTVIPAVVDNVDGNKIIKTVTDLIAESTEIIEPGVIFCTQYARPGGYPEAVKDFESLNPDKVRDLPGSNPGKHGILSDGRDIIVRLGSSKDNHPTLEIQHKPHRYKIKFRYKGKSSQT